MLWNGLGRTGFSLYFSSFSLPCIFSVADACLAMADTADMKRRKKNTKNMRAEVLLKRKEVTDAVKNKNC